MFSLIYKLNTSKKEDHRNRWKDSIHECTRLTSILRCTKKSKLARLSPNSIFLAAIEVGKIIAKFDISGQIRPTCIFEFTSWQEYLISNMAHQTRVRQSRLAIGSPTPLSTASYFVHVILKIRPMSYFHEGNRTSLQGNSHTLPKKPG